MDKDEIQQQKQKAETEYLKEMFNSQGWKIFVAQCVKERRGLADIFADRNASIEDIRFAQGRIMELNFTIGFEGFIKQEVVDSPRLGSLNPFEYI